MLLHVLAGPPGAGKTATLRALGEAVTIINEPARRVLAQQRGVGGTGTGDQDRAQFVALMLDMAKADYDSASGLTVFDRGLPDLLAFCAHYGLPPDPVRQAMSVRNYARDVFWFPPWQEIYIQDKERRLDFAGAKAFGELIHTAYCGAGYSLIPVPFVSPQARADFILDRIGA